MLAEYRTKSNIGIGLFLIATAIALTVAFLIGTKVAVEGAQLIHGVGIIFFFYGLYNYAKGKGYHGAWALLGFLSIIGLIILVSFPDRHKPIKQKLKDEQKICGNCYFWNEGEGGIATGARPWGKPFTEPEQKSGSCEKHNEVKFAHELCKDWEPKNKTGNQ